MLTLFVNLRKTMAEMEEQIYVSFSADECQSDQAANEDNEEQIVEDAPPDVQPQKELEEETFKNELKFIVMNAVCGSLIGRGGEVVKAFNDKYKVHISIPVTNTNIRTLILTGKNSCIISALNELIPKFKAAPVQAFDRKEFHINLIIPDGLAPILIGAGGSRVGAIRKETKCSIKVFDHNLPSSGERLVIIAGGLDGIISVLSTIMNLNEKSRFERNFRRVDCSRIHREDLELGLTHENIPGTRFAQSMKPPRDYRPIYSEPYGPLRPLMQYNAPIFTTQVSIPSDHAKFIIGPKGSNIRRIESMTRCKIHLEEEKPECTIRIISITGTERQINEAEYYLQQSIMNHQQARRRID